VVEMRRLDEIDTRLRALESPRCVTIKGTVHASVYQTEKLP
jgi:hypothetical protein